MRFFPIPLLTKFEASNLQTGSLLNRHIPANTCWSPRRLEDVVNVAISGFPRHREDILENKKLV